MHLDPLDSRQLLTVVTLARTRSFTEAAKELGLTQSAVSHSLKALERQLDQVLIERSGRQMRLTPAGDYLVRESTELLRKMQGIRNRLENLEDWGQGRLRIGATPSCCNWILPPVLRELKQSFPGCSIVVKPDRGYANLERLRHDEVDIVLAVSMTDGAQGLEKVDWFSDELQVILPPFHPLAKKEKLTADDIDGETIHLFGNDSQSDSVIREFLGSNGVRTQEFIEVGNIEAVKEMVKIGQGIAFLPEWVVQNEIRRGSLVASPLGFDPLPRDWSIYWTGRRLNLLEETFFGLCMEAKDALLGRRTFDFA
ncbi:LysR family transcriptional regulator [Rubellicoccus peritrichatus]|uniref:LysR family transcriptional regulator n=1 Tax=Rubellicoccus peritrichatus TaxID=3080537 RepID=A0AAQ3L619_9BACT|nr:LysR family transcriptional regulator [Puniceicoccus sp. CR14]WOO39920.1 LysR family transcriptional regulator [Puniceicoccus sp. CR14]